MQAMEKRFTTAMGLLSVQEAIAQAAPTPLEGIGGKPMPADHVRLEGSGGSGHSLWLLRFHQAACARLGRPVELPPEGTTVVRVTRDDHDTATLSIEFTRRVTLTLGSDCVLSWQKQEPKLRVFSPQGACTLYIKARMASGMCRPTPNARMTTLATMPQELLGLDRARNCARTAAQTGSLRNVQCVELAPEPRRSFLYRAGADRRGIVLESTTTMAPNDEEVEDIRATDVRKNTTVGSDMHDLADSQGFTVNPDMGTRP
jgi:hypothetical protein